MNKKEQMNQKILRQQAIVDGAKNAKREMTPDEQSEFDALQREVDTLKREIDAEERGAEDQIVVTRAVQEERQRVREITALCRDFEVDPEEHISSGSTVDQARAAVLEAVKVRMKPSVAGVSSVTVGLESADKLREAGIDGLLLRMGKSVEKPASGARDLSKIRLRDLAIMCVELKGKTNARIMDDDSLYREALTPDSQFSAILDNTVRKNMAQAYKAVQTTYQAWTVQGNNQDFKPTKAYQISEAGDLVEIKQSGEFKFDEMTDNGVSRTLATFGRSWGFSRQAMINDDLNMLSRVPEAYVRAAARGINKLVYLQLGGNGKIYDGKELFHADHKNLAASGDYIGVGSVGAGRAAMRKQKNLRGKETLNITPAFLLVPSTLETDMQKFLWSTSDPAATNPGVVNPFRNALTPVVDAVLDDLSGGTAWYLIANPGDVDTVEVTYLNGEDMPKLESQVGFDFLGMKWRIYIDYGVTVLDFRGLYKNPGKAEG